MTKKSFCSIFAFAVFLITGDVFAVVKSHCTVTEIQLDDRRLAVWCKGDVEPFYSFASGSPSAGGCPVTSQATLDIWHSLFESAYMAGRVTDFDFNYPDLPTCTVKRITARVRLR